MLIDFSIQNYASFNTAQELNMVASTTTQEACDLDNVYKVDQFGIKNILQSAAIFGSNGSGKSNFVASLKVFKNLVLDSLDSVNESSKNNIPPFLLKESFFDIPTEFEVSFLAKDNLYRYGISMVNGEISEEWLYWTKEKRETMLFQRVKQTIKYNNRSFSEAKLFVKKDGDIWTIEKTKTHVPFLSVLSKFDGERSNVVTNWFSKLNIISGIEETGFKDFTIRLFENNKDFKLWALEILKSLHIDNINVVEYEKHIPIPKGKREIADKDLDAAVSAIQGYFEKNIFKEKRIVVEKSNQKGDTYSLPLIFESEGTCKLIYLLGPLYDIIKNNEILVIDEFDNKFHTLLSKFIIKLYNKHNFGKSQLIVTCHDTNLLTNELFRRDQIWFVEQNQDLESELFSLVEYKDHYTRKDKSYSRDYLLGKYGSIPLFPSISALENMIDG
jgi:AAA15 family ATPase/GTPase